MNRNRMGSADREEYFAAIDERSRRRDKGVFISGEAIDAWLASWGTDKTLPMPEPDIFPQAQETR
jgi:predicted transcriptional regulator